MNQRIRQISILAAVLLVVAFSLGAKSCKTELEKELSRIGIPKERADFKHAYKTALGVQVRSVVPVPADVLPLVDEGISTQLAKLTAKYPTWTIYNKPEHYTVLFVEGDGYLASGPPFLWLQGYKTAGTCICGPWDNLSKPYAKPAPIIAPHQGKVNWQYREYLRNTVWYESEHVREWKNDKAVFAQYANSGDVHPHVP